MFTPVCVHTPSCPIYLHTVARHERYQTKKLGMHFGMRLGMFTSKVFFYSFTTPFFLSGNIFFARKERIYCCLWSAVSSATFIFFTLWHEFTHKYMTVLRMQRTCRRADI